MSNNKWAEEAAYFQAHKDDPEDWNGPIEAPVVAPRDGLAISVTVRFSPEEANALRHTARQERKTFSQIVREAVHNHTHPVELQATRGAIVLSMNRVAAVETRPGPTIEPTLSSNPQAGALTLSTSAGRIAAD